MFKKTNRLAKTRDVERVLGQGRGFFNRFFSVRFVPGAGHRLTVVASTKVSKKAVTRNRLKRIVREFLRLHLSHMVPGEYVVSLRPASAATEEAVLSALKNLLEKSKLLP